MREKVHNWFFKSSRRYRSLMKYFDKFSLPGFQGVRIYTVLSFFFKGLKSKEINMKASAIAYNFFMALFPATIFFFTLIAYIPIEGLQDQIFDFIKSITPAATFEAIQHTLMDILNSREGGLLSFGFLMAMYFSTSGINSMIDAFNDYTHSIQARKPIKQQLTSLWLTFYAALLIVLNIVLNILGDWALLLLGFGDTFEYYVLHAIKLFLTILFIYCLISGMFFYGPAKKRRWPFFSAGSTLATVLSVSATYGFIYYVNNFNSYNKLYGSIGTLMVVMLLIYINALVMLIGFELNVSIDRALAHKISAEKITPENMEGPK